MKKQNLFWLKKFSLVFTFFISISSFNNVHSIRIPTPKQILKSIGKTIYSNFHKLVIGSNFHIVENGKCYRFKQLSAKKLKHYIYKYGIKTIINLRGKNNPNYAAEKAACDELGITLHSIPMSAQRMPTRKEIEQVLHIFDTAQYPLGIHCFGGSDRTGLVCGLYAIDQQHRCKKNGLKQLSMLYGHFRYRYPSMRKFLNMWQGRDWFFENYRVI